jgi:hypothetical protein
VSAATALVAHLFKPQLLKAGDALLEQSTDHEAALAPPKRERARAEATADPLLAERQLASLTWQAINQGLAGTTLSPSDRSTPAPN